MGQNVNVRWERERERSSMKASNNYTRALLNAQYLRAEPLFLDELPHLVGDHVADRPVVPALEVVLAVGDVHAQALERVPQELGVDGARARLLAEGLDIRGGGLVHVHAMWGVAVRRGDTVRRDPGPPRRAPARRGRLHLADARAAPVRDRGRVFRRALLGATAHAHDLRREGGKLVGKVLGAQVAVQQVLAAPEGPRALYKYRAERLGDHGRRGAPGREGERPRRDAVRLDVAEEEQFLPGGVVPEEERGGLVHARRVVVAVGDRRHADGDVGGDRPVGLCELERVVQQLVVIVLRAPGGEFRPDAIREHGFDVVDNVSRGVNTFTRALERARGEDEAVDVVQVGVGDEETADRRVDVVR